MYILRCGILPEISRIVHNDKSVIYLEDITILNDYSPNNRVSKYSEAKTDRTKGRTLKSYRICCLTTRELN